MATEPFDEYQMQLPLLSVVSGPTLAETREFLAENRDDGVTCPACDQFVKVYRRKLTSVTARILIAMHHTPGDAEGYMHLPTMRLHVPGAGGGDSIKAAYWQLIEPMPNVERDDGSNRTGWWRLTPRGEAFVRDTLRIPTYALIYDGACLGHDESTTVGIRDVLGTRFHYDDLMAGV